MPAELLTANEVSTRLGVDRSTVYRMAMDGRLRAIKIGTQWRFPPSTLGELLTADVVGAEGVGMVPMRAARTAVLQSVAPVLGVMMIVTDMDGQLLTGVANPCPWFVEHGSDPSVLEECTRQWRAMAADHVFTPRLDVGPHGFACARSFVRDDVRLVGMVIASGIGPDPDDPAAAHASGFHHLGAAQRDRLLDALPRIAASLSTLTCPSRSTDIGSTS